VDYETACTVIVEIGDLPANFAIIQVVVPEPKRHDAEFARRV
jgi:hypothetical protein